MSATGEQLFSAGICRDIELELKWRAEDFHEAVDRSPKLAMVTNFHEGATETYMRLKSNVGTGLGFAVESVVLPDGADPIPALDRLAATDTVDGIIVQLPLHDPNITDEVLAHIPGEKDVDGLGPNAQFEPATPLAIMRLIQEYVPKNKRELAIVGQGRLVGEPLGRIAARRGFEVVVFDKSSSRLDIVEGLNNADVIVGATGQPGLLTPDLFNNLDIQRVLIDAGTTERSGTLLGDVSDELLAAAIDHGWPHTPPQGGVGPLTIRCLLKSTMTAAERRAGLSA